MTAPDRLLERHPPRRILLVRLSAVGDIVMAGIVARALKARWPQARVTWLCEPAYAGLAAANGDVDEVLTWDKAEWRGLARRLALITLARRMAATRGELKGHGFDLVLDLQGLFKSGLLAALAGGGMRVGLGSREGSGLFMTHVLPRTARRKVIGSEYRELAARLGAPLGELDFRVDWFRPADAHAVAMRLRELGVAGPYVALCPFTTRPQKHWLEERWAALASALRERFGVDTVLLGGPDDAAAAERIAAAAPGTRSLVGRTTLPEGAAAIAGASLVIGVDTGLTHMGMLSATPTFALFGSTVPYTEVFQATDRIFYKNLPCAPCKRHPTCDGRFDCMREIGSGELLAHAAQVLEPRP